MGNCMNTGMKQSSLVLGGDDWESPLPQLPEEAAAGSEFSSKKAKKAADQEKQNLMEKEKGITSFHDPAKTGSPIELKIKITKKQLEEMLRKVDISNNDLSLAQVLTQLISLSSMDPPGFQEERRRSWRPSLHSIPESEVY